MDVAAELRDLAARGETGRLDVTAGRVSAQVWLREGRLHAVTMSSAAPALGMRLVSGGLLSLTNLGSALALQHQHPGMRLGDALVRRGLVTRQEVEAVAWEQMCDEVAGILALSEPTGTFTPDDPVTPAPAGAPAVNDVLAAAATRIPRWQRVVRQVGGPDTVPDLTDAMLATPDTSLRPQEWAVVCRVDGRRSLMAIAQQAGFTLLEAASILATLVAAGLVSVPTPATPPALPAPVAAPAALPPPAPVALPPPEPVVLPPPEPAPAAPEPAAPAPAPAGLGPSDLFDDPSDLLRELSEIGGADGSARRRAR